MKKLLESNKRVLIFITILLLIWRIFLFFIEKLSILIPLYSKFLGPIPWANFDGVHYLSIAQYGYQIYQQAFFPMFPLLIKFLSIFFGGDYIVSSLFLVYISLFTSLVFLYKLVSIDFGKDIAKWTLVFFLFFPTSFFLGAIYTESIFLVFLFSSFYFVRRKNFLLASLTAGFASGTKIIGVLLLIVILFEFYLTKIKKINSIKNYIYNIISYSVISLFGFLSYVFFLWKIYNDPLMFIHVQPNFGAERSGGEIILLPQVFFRYAKILTTLNPLTQSYLVALLEISTFIVFFSILIFFRRKLDSLIYCLACLLLFSRRFLVHYLLYPDTFWLPFQYL
ncbi:MAG: hypothetical protein QXF25_00585 [Candidatus Pacearchaeota archaeon]